MRPWKRTLFAPVWPAKLSVRTVTVRLHLGLFLFRLVWATHLWATRRPGRDWVNANRILAASLRVKWRVVPTGSLRAMCGSAVPSRHLRADWKTAVRTGMGGCSTCTPPPGAALTWTGLLVW